MKMANTLCIDLTHRVSSGYTWRSYCTLPGSRSRTWREKSYNFLPCWPEVGETRFIRSGVRLATLGFGVKAFCHQTWSFSPRLPLGARLSHLCRCRAPKVGEHVHHLVVHGQVAQHVHHQVGQDGKDVHHSAAAHLVPEAQPFADRIRDICGRLVWKLVVQMNCLHEKGSHLRIQLAVLPPT